MTSLRKAINDKCKSCIYDNLAAGTWRQQVTLCAVDLCSLYEVRPKTGSPIPKSVLAYYGIKSGASQALKSDSEVDQELQKVCSYE